MPKQKTRSIKVGDLVATKGTLQGVVGVVVKIREGKNIEDHGLIDVAVNSVDRSHTYKWSWLSPGDIEKFVHFGWEDIFDIIY